MYGRTIYCLGQKIPTFEFVNVKPMQRNFSVQLQGSISDVLLEID